MPQGIHYSLYKRENRGLERTRDDTPRYELPQRGVLNLFINTQWWTDLSHLGVTCSGDRLEGQTLVVQPFKKHSAV